MRFPYKTVIAALIVGGLGIGGFIWFQSFMAKRLHPSYRQAEVTRGKIVSVINATGTVQPVLSVSVGSFVSGPIKNLYVDFNADVKKGDLLAEIDPSLYEAALIRDKAVLTTHLAEVERAKAQLEKARNDLKRADSLRSKNKNFISEAELDQFKFDEMSLEAALAVAYASVDQANANLKTSEANLGYTKIVSPVNGKVINRKIDEGQTLAAQFQTPELFIVAPDMRAKMYILASVDEADIGSIRRAQDLGLPVKFTVDAYPDDLFEGAIHQIRMSSSTTQNVVTYPVVVKTANPDLKLMPGMTASLSFLVEQVEDVLRIPNTALRFFPPSFLVRPEDRKLVDGSALDSFEDNDSAKAKQTAMDKAEARRDRKRRVVWLDDDDGLKAVQIVTGLSDNKWSQLVTGEIKEGQKLAIGLGGP